MSERNPTMPAAERAQLIAAAFRSIGEYVTQCLQFIAGGKLPGPAPIANPTLLQARRWDVLGQSLVRGVRQTAAQELALAALLRLGAATLLGWPPLRHQAGELVLQLARQRLYVDPSAASREALALSPAAVLALLCLGGDGDGDDDGAGEATAGLSAALKTACLSPGDQLLVAALVERQHEVKAPPRRRLSVLAARRSTLLQTSRGALREQLMASTIVPHWSKPELAAVLTAEDSGLGDALIAVLADPASELGAFPSPPLVAWLQALADLLKEHGALQPTAQRLLARIGRVARLHLANAELALKELEQQTGLAIAK